MKNRQSIENFPAYFAYLLSGLLFFSLPASAENFVSAMIIYALTFAGVFVFLRLFLKLKAKEAPGKTENERIGIFFSITGVLFCSVLYAFFTKTLAAELPRISREFSGGRFSHFFVLLSLLLSLYIGKRGFFSYSGVCILVLPLLVLPLFLTFFNFLEYGEAFSLEKAFLNQRFDFSWDHVFDALISCAGVSLLFFIKTPLDRPSAQKGLGAAYLAFAVLVFVEGIKYILWFGTENLALVARPDRTMLSQVPFMNVQELFLFFFYISYMLKIAVFSAAARSFAKNFLKIAAKGKSLPDWCSYLLIFVLFYSAYLILPFSQSKTVALISFFGIFICFFACLWQGYYGKGAKVAKPSVGD